MTINSHSEYEAAKRRIRELGELPEGTPSAETELNVLVELTTAWEDEHADDPGGRPVSADAGARLTRD